LISKENTPHIYESSIKRKPVKADHQVFSAKNRKLSESATSNTVTADNSPKKSTYTRPRKAYETASGNKFMGSTQRSNMGEDDDKYLKSEDIERLADPKASMAKLIVDLPSKNWEVQVNACNVLRSIAIHDKQLLDSTFFRTVTTDLIKIAASLRSSVCKNGLLVFQDLFKTWGKNLEFELESIINTLIKKGNDTNVFISAEAEKTLLSMCASWNEQKVLTTLSSHANNRSALVKEKVAKWWEQIIIKLGNKFSNFKDKDKLIDHIATYLSDASQEVRNNAKQAFNHLSNLFSKDEFEAMIMKSLNEQKYNKVKELLEKGFHTSMSDFNPTKQSFYRGGSNRNVRRTVRNGASSIGFDINGISKTPNKKKSSLIFSKYQDNENMNRNMSKSVNKPSPSIYSKRTSLKSNNQYGETSSRLRVNNTYGVANPNSSEIIKGGDHLNYTDSEDSKTMKSTPNNFKKHRRISRKNIKKLDDVSVPMPPDFK
jgi:hypothetical protein